MQPERAIIGKILQIYRYFLYFCKLVNKQQEKAEEEKGLTENKEKDKTSGVISGSSEKKEKSIPELVGSKVTNTWTHMRFLTKVLSVFALAGLIYLIFWTGARRSFRKMKNRNPSLQR